MPVEISTQIIHASYATVINRIQPNANIYDNPNQQGTDLPAWFIVHRSPVEIRKELGKRHGGSRFEITYSIDIWYMLKQNITRLYDQYTEIAERLDEELEYLPVFNSDAVLHVHDRSWSLEMNALKYSTTLRFKVYGDVSDVIPKMQVIEDVDVFLKNQNESFITFTNEDHPEFDVSFPTSLSTKTGNKINLPSVSGSFVDDEYTWKPDSWSIGKFGELVQVDKNMTANLVWVGESRLAQVSFVNTEYPQFDVILPEPAFVLKGSVYELPSVSGSFDDGTFKYTPTAWSIGAFGESVVVNEDTVVELVWNKQALIEEHTGYVGQSHNSNYSISVGFWIKDANNHTIPYDENKLYTFVALYKADGTEPDNYTKANCSIVGIPESQGNPKVLRASIDHRGFQTIGCYCIYTTQNV
jgi:hypothetical protein